MGENDDGTEYFIGPICSNSGTEIKIGVFTDEFCSTFAKDGMDIDTMVQTAFADENADGTPQLTYHNLENVASGSCISCLFVDENADANDNNGEVEGVEACQQLYEMAAKCETPYGFDGVLSWNNEEYYNQAAQEDNVCAFMKAVNGGAYDEEGEISVSSSNVSSGAGMSSVAGWQKFLIAALVLGTVGLVVFACTLHSSLTKGAKADLSSQGGAMA
uniref:Uncharacterized protein n=1 Tax=Helicotheca tamesis TaxID=374047 RepID=A0A6U0HTJ0_9STRA|mmetsp:Transcript_8200/g.11273  ORF Transcript_8200/g.11273 Transcript_8200/m.11273 type:complete len:217 (+) Transcript_8200:204-854(+)